MGQDVDQGGTPVVTVADHGFYMRKAYQEALKALDDGEVPVGAVIVNEVGSIIGRGANSMERLKDATAHAEIIAIGAASQHQPSWRLNGCTLYATLEPCLMCLGAILNSRLSTIVYGTTDPRLGAVDTHPVKAMAEGSYRVFPAVVSGVMAAESSALLKSFFQRLREKE
jgi:tRNA(adenine34) deaminase